eukprot:263003_1
MSLNVAYIHPNIPGYCYEDAHLARHKEHCFAFMELITNALGWWELIRAPETYQSSIVETQGSVFNFTLNCYNDLMNTIFVLFDLGVAHNDITEGNVYIDRDTFKCYLIDYGAVIYLKKEMFTKGYKCLPHSCSPIGYYYANQRNRFRDMYYKKIYSKHGHDDKGLFPDQILRQFVMFDKQYVITTFVFHAMIKLYCLQNANNIDEVCELNQQIHHKAKGGFHQQWCKRYQIIQGVKGIIPDALWNVFKIFEKDALFLNETICPCLTAS